MQPGKIDEDLEKNWAVVAEAIQTVLRREKFERPYEALKAFTRGQLIDRKMMKDFIDSLSVSDALKQELMGISPQSFGQGGQVPRPPAVQAVVHVQRQPAGAPQSVEANGSVVGGSATGTA